MSRISPRPRAAQDSVRHPEPAALEALLPPALARRLGRPVTVHPMEDGGAARTAHDLLVCQLGGSSTWHIAPPAGAALTLRLQAGSVLHAPAGSVCTPRHGSRSRVLPLALGDRRNEREEEDP
ncbi:hypothetical protein AB0F18_10785 [Streptomyces sp. NPDC029216]|uniref:hypothetical protein n=1 Tax=Streptomyces sp. NPDC029216 TaxID=3154701 RepID=UPI0033F3B100